MRPDEWWRNFGLGLEVDVAGAFIYNGIKLLDDTESFNHATDVFEILYNLSVGIERLAKVAIVLVEYYNDIKIEELEESLITHNTQELIERLNKHKKLGLSDINREFIALLSKFYKSYRYARYSFGSVPNIEEEKVQFLKFISRHLKLGLNTGDAYALFLNTNQIKRFVGKVVKKITQSIFHVISEQSTRLNIYTDELRGESKALKIFYGDKLDFIDETTKKKEIILFLMDPKSSGRHIDLLRSFGSLELDPAMTPDYIKALLNDTQLPFVEGEIDELYTEVKNVRERLEFLEVIDNDYLSYDPEEDS